MSGSSSVGRASAFQAESREFEPRLPLHLMLEIIYIVYYDNLLVAEGFAKSAHVAQLVERILGKDEVHQFDSGHGLQRVINKKF